MKIRNWIIALFCSLFVSVWANDGVYLVNGNHLVPLNETDISIEKEVLTIGLGDDGFASVDVRYVFFNNANDKVVLMGFEADAPYNDLAAITRTFRHPYIEDFTVVMNGEKLSFENALVAVNNGDTDFKPLDLNRWKATKDEDFAQSDRLYDAENDSIITFAYAYYFKANFKKGRNEVIVLDVVGPSERVVWGQAEPELNKLQLEKNNKHNNPGDKPDLNSKSPAFEGELKAGNGWQTVNFKWNRRGRYLAIEMLSTQKENDVAAIAELYVLGDESKRLSREPWTVKYASSEEENGNHWGDKVFDLQESTYWQTVKGADFPHLLVIDLGSEQIVNGIEYLPRAEQGAPGSIKKFRVFVY